MKTKTLIILIILIGLGLGGFFIFQELKEKASEEALRLPLEAEEQPKKTKAWEGLASIKLPSSYQIKDIKYYGETGKCYVAGAMGLLKHWGATEQEVQNYWQWIQKEGQGGPPDFALAFKEFGYSEYLYFGYSREPAARFPKPYFKHFLKNAEKQLKVFESKEEALFYLKNLIASNIPVMVALEGNPELQQEESEDNDFILVDGYDEEKIYYHTFEGRTSSIIPNFLKKWELQSGSDMFSEFPGNYSIIFLKLR